MCLDSHRLYAMHDGTFQTMQQTAQRNLVQQIDLETQQTIMAAHEFSEHFELVCLAPGQGGGDWGNELYAGAVHRGNLCVGRAALKLLWIPGHGSATGTTPRRQCCAGFCTHCYQLGVPSLCYHKAKSATAALCVFDLRAQMSMASLPPCLQDMLAAMAKPLG